MPALETVHDTVQYRHCIFSLIYRPLRIKLKRQNSLLSCVRERERVHCKCTVQCTVHYIITFFNVGYVLLYVIYHLNFTVFIYVTRISRYIQGSVLSAVSRDRGRSWNASPADTGVRLYIMYALAQKAALSEPQNQHFNSTMRPIKLHKTSRMYISFRKLAVFNRGGSTQATRGCGRAWHVFQ